MQRLFSTFPGKWPGLGLLLLRIVVGTALLGQSTGMLRACDKASALCLASVTAAAAGVLLIAGFLTPLAAATAATATIAFAFLQSSAQSIATTLGAVVVIAALGLLGPGAYSVDARLFGRREIVIPPHPRSDVRH